MIWQNISAMSAPESADAPVNRPSMKKWVVLLVVLGALIGLGTMVKAWMDRRSGAAAQPVVFSGGSEHWDQNEVPISMQCGACHEKEFRQWAGSDHAWAFRKLGDQWESEAFHNMKLDAHGSILQFSTNGHGRMVHADHVFNLLARGMGHRENSPGAVSGSCQGRRFSYLERCMGREPQRMV